MGEAGRDQRTPDLSPVVQELVDRPGWSGGNALALIITGTGRRTADSYDGSAAAAPLLHIDYSLNTAPVVSITAPPDASTHPEGDPVTFTGTSTDAEDGDLTASLSWSSDLDGPLGTGGSLTTSSLSLGTHTVTASSTDSGGLVGTAQVTLTINARPVVTVTSPESGSTFLVGEFITFSGAASDAEDGDLSAQIVWDSNRTGVLGTGESISVSTLPKGKHTISATATDGDGGTQSAQITVRIRGK